MPKRKYNPTGNAIVPRKKRRIVKAYRKRALRRVPPGFPTSRVVKMRYVENFSLFDIAGGMSHYRFRANSVYDPNQSGVGHQAIGFDQWSAFYNRFTVIGSKLTVQIGGQGDSETLFSPIYFGIRTDSDTSSITDYNHIMEQGSNRWKLMQIKGNSTLTLRKNFSLKKHFKLSSVKDNQSTYGHTSSANPNEQAFFDVWAQPFDKVANFSVGCVAIIDYIVVCSEPADLPQS